LEQLFAEKLDDAQRIQQKRYYCSWMSGVSDMELESLWLAIAFDDWPWKAEQDWKLLAKLDVSSCYRLVVRLLYYHLVDGIAGTVGA
jgi:hypothetical protein